MTKIDIFSGFLGAGKTTLIKKLIKEAYAGEKLVLIENEFGEIGIDGAFMQDAGINVTEMNSGCICCSLVGDFGEALKKVLSQFKPDRILIEPSGVGKLSDVIRAVEGIHAEDAVLNVYCTVADASRCKMYLKNFGEFFGDQIANAKGVVLSHTDGLSENKIEECIELLRGYNKDCVIVSTPWDIIDGREILVAMEQNDTLEKELEHLREHHHHEHDCTCHEHHHDHDCTCHEHHHHDHDCDCHEHHHDHNCTCHEHHHHADEVFVSWGKETSKKYTKDKIESILAQLTNKDAFGIVLRAKGIVATDENEFVHFDYVPGEADVRFGSPSVTGRICVIGSNLNEKALMELFEV
jgi:G3E family GTPase